MRASALYNTLLLLCAVCLGPGLPAANAGGEAPGGGACYEYVAQTVHSVTGRDPAPGLHYILALDTSAFFRDPVVANAIRDAARDVIGRRQPGDRLSILGFDMRVHAARLWNASSAPECSECRDAIYSHIPTRERPGPETGHDFERALLDVKRRLAKQREPNDWVIVMLSAKETSEVPTGRSVSLLAAKDPALAEELRAWEQSSGMPEHGYPHALALPAAEGGGTAGERRLWVRLFFPRALEAQPVGTTLHMHRAWPPSPHTPARPDASASGGEGTPNSMLGPSESYPPSTGGVPAWAWWVVAALLLLLWGLLPFYVQVGGKAHTLRLLGRRAVEVRGSSPGAHGSVALTPFRRAVLVDHDGKRHALPARSEVDGAEIVVGGLRPGGQAARVTRSNGGPRRDSGAPSGGAAGGDAGSGVRPRPRGHGR